MTKDCINCESHNKALNWEDNICKEGRAQVGECELYKRSEVKEND